MDWPTTLVAYHRSDTFTEETVPESLLSEHDLKRGVWAMIRVLEGELTFVDLENGREATLSSDAPGFVEPDQKHHVRVDGPVKFYVEFYRDAADRSDASEEADADD